MGTTVLPTGGTGTGSGPPGPTTTAAPGATTPTTETAPFTAGTTAVAPETAPLTPEPTVEPTTFPTSHPLVLTVGVFTHERRSVNSFSWNTESVTITESNKNTALDNLSNVNNLTYEEKFIYNDSGEISDYNPWYFIHYSIGGGATSYRIKYEGIIPGIYPLRYVIVPYIPTAEEAIEGISRESSTNQYFNCSTNYNISNFGIMISNDMRVRCLGNEAFGPQTLKIIVDDGFTTVEQDLTWNRANYIDSGISCYINGYFVQIKIPISIAIDNDLIFDLSPTEDRRLSTPYINLNSTKDGVMVDFGAGKQKTNWFSLDKSERYINYQIKDGFVYSKIRLIPAGLDTGVLNTQTYYYRENYGWGYSNYGLVSNTRQLRSPHHLGVLTLSLKNKATQEETVFHKKLYWYCLPTQGPSVHWNKINISNTIRDSNNTYEYYHGYTFE